VLCFLIFRYIANRPLSGAFTSTLTMFRCSRESSSGRPADQISHRRSLLCTPRGTGYLSVGELLPGNSRRLWWARLAHRSDPHEIRMRSLRPGAAAGRMPGGKRAHALRVR
jgi:hypothetical protein